MISLQSTSYEVTGQLGMVQGSRRKEKLQDARNEQKTVAQEIVSVLEWHREIQRNKRAEGHALKET